jgi:tetratricopeptide (TPR) repeat protein
MYFRLRNVEQADAHFQQSLAIREKTLADKPGDPAAKWNVARVCGAIGDFRLQAGNLAGSEPMCQRSLTILQEISKADQGRADYRRDLGVAHYRYGQLLLRLDNRDDAIAQFEQCRSVRQALASGEKATERLKMDWRLALAHCGEHEDAAKYVAAVEADPSVDTELLVLAARAYAVCSSVAGIDAGLAAEYRDKSLATLQKVLSAGFQDVFTLQMEPDFDSIREDPRFEQLGSKTAVTSPPST